MHLCLTSEQALLQGKALCWYPCLQYHFATGQSSGSLSGSLRCTQVNTYKPSRREVLFRNTSLTASCPTQLQGWCARYVVRRTRVATVHAFHTVSQVFATQPQLTFNHKRNSRCRHAHVSATPPDMTDTHCGVRGSCLLSA